MNLSAYGYRHITSNTMTATVMIEKHFINFNFKKNLFHMIQPISAIFSNLEYKDKSAIEL